jgi:hypothetical protein
MHDDRIVPLEDWVAVLSISTRFDFEKIRNRAIAEIDSGQHILRGGSGAQLDPVTKIVLAEKHDVPQWFEPAFRALCQRAEPIDELEGEKLGIKVTTRLMEERSTAWRDRAGLSFVSQDSDHPHVYASESATVKPTVQAASFFTPYHILSPISGNAREGGGKKKKGKKGKR